MENEDVLEKKVKQALGHLLSAISDGITCGDLDCVEIYSKAFQRIIAGVRS